MQAADDAALRKVTTLDARMAAMSAVSKLYIDGVDEGINIVDFAIQKTKYKNKKQKQQNNNSSLERTNRRRTSLLCCFTYLLQRERAWPLQRASLAQNRSSDAPGSSAA